MLHCGVHPTHTRIHAALTHTFDARDRKCAAQTALVDGFIGGLASFSSVQVAVRLVEPTNRFPEDLAISSRSRLIEMTQKYAGERKESRELSIARILQ
jgi:hypothetical protein